MSRYRALLFGLVGSVVIAGLYLAADHWHVVQARSAARWIEGPGELSIGELWYLKCRASVGDFRAAYSLAKYYDLVLEDHVAGEYWLGRWREGRAQDLRARGVRELTLDEVRTLRLKADAGDPDAAEALAKNLSEVWELEENAQVWRERARELRKK